MDAAFDHSVEKLALHWAAMLQPMWSRMLTGSSPFLGLAFGASVVIGER